MWVPAPRSSGPRVCDCIFWNTFHARCTPTRFAESNNTVTQRRRTHSELTHENILVPQYTKSVLGSCRIRHTRTHTDTHRHTQTRRQAQTHAHTCVHRKGRLSLIQCLYCRPTGHRLYFTQYSSFQIFRPASPNSTQTTTCGRNVV